MWKGKSYSLFIWDQSRVASVYLMLWIHGYSLSLLKYLRYGLRRVGCQYLGLSHQKKHPLVLIQYQAGLLVQGRVIQYPSRDDNTHWPTVLDTMVLTKRPMSSAESLAATALRNFCSQKKQLKERRKKTPPPAQYDFLLIFSVPQSLFIRGVTTVWMSITTTMVMVEQGFHWGLCS